MVFEMDVVGLGLFKLNRIDGGLKAQHQYVKALSEKLPG